MMSNILSGFSGSYRLKTGEGLGGFVRSVVGYPSNNIFNSTFNIPLVSDEEGTLVGEHVFNYATKPTAFNYLYSDYGTEWNYKEWGTPGSYGEAYFLRGAVKMPNNPPNTHHMSI